MSREDIGVLLWLSAPFALLLVAIVLQLGGVAFIALRLRAQRNRQSEEDAIE